MRSRIAAAIVVLALATAPAALANGIAIKDGNGTFFTQCSLTISSVEYPCHILEGMSSGTPTPMAVDSLGNPVTTFFAPASSRWQASVSLSSGSNTTLHAACGPGLKNYVTSIDWSSVDVPTADELDLNDNTTAIFKDALPAGGDKHRSFWWQNPKFGTANTAMNIQLTGSPVNAVLVNAGGFCAP